jgi:putative transcriptional regulator
MLRFHLDEILIYKMKTRSWLSKQTGIDNNTLAKICNNEAKEIKLEILENICDALHCELSDLIKYVPNNKLNVE